MRISSGRTPSKKPSPRRECEVGWIAGEARRNGARLVRGAATTFITYLITLRKSSTVHHPSLVRPKECPPAPLPLSARVPSSSNGSPPRTVSQASFACPSGAFSMPRHLLRPPPLTAASRYSGTTTRPPATTRTTCRPSIHHRRTLRVSSRQSIRRFQTCSA